MTATRTVLLTGATGMVGSQVLRLLLDDPAVGQVISIGRREAPVRDDRLRQVVHADFRDLAPVQSHLAGIDVCFHCLGVYQGQVSKQAFFEITCDYLKALSDALKRNSPEATFVLFSASGADPGETSMATFARAKGRAENLLNAAGFPRTYIFRPGYIHPTGARRPTGLAYRLLTPVAGGLMRAIPRLGITDRDLATAMVTVGLQGTRQSGVLEMRQIREIASAG